MRHATAQRRALSDSLLEVGAGAPTLCDGWTAYDLAAHCWVRERSPRALLGIGLKRYEHLAEREMAKAKERMGFIELATRLRDRPITPITLVPGGDDLVNSVEYLIHTEDVRRANELPRRAIDPALANRIWRRLPLLGRALFASSPVGVRLEREGTTETARVRPGSSTVTLVGRPEELLLFAFGRERATDVRVIGDDRSVEAFATAERRA